MDSAGFQQSKRDETNQNGNIMKIYWEITKRSGLIQGFYHRTFHQSWDMNNAPVDCYPIPEIIPNQPGRPGHNLFVCILATPDIMQ